MPIICTCLICGAAVKRSPSAIGPRVFCGHRCFTQWKRTRTGSAAGGWRSGTKTDKATGRVKVRMPGHPRADTHGYVYRYHLVAERMIGRLLRPEEVVHHIDNNPANDDPSNLHVFPSEAEHQRHHGILRGGINGKQSSRDRARCSAYAHADRMANDA